MSSEIRAVKKQLKYETFLWIPNFLFRSFGYAFINLSEATKMATTSQSKLKWRKYLMYAFFAVNVGFMVFCRYCLHRTLNEAVKARDVKYIIRACTYLIYGLEANIKFLTFLRNSKRLRNISDTLKQSYPKTLSELANYPLKEYYWSKSVRATISLFFIISWVILTSPIIQSTVQYIYDVMTSNENGADNAAIVQFAYLHPVPVEYIFVITKPLRYICIYVIDCINCHFLLSSNMGTDLWLIGFTTQICMHMDYIGRMLTQYEPSVDNSRADCEFVSTLIKKHQLMLNLNKQLNEIFGISLVFSITTTTSLLCVLAVQLTLEGLGMEFFKFLLFLSTCIAEFFLLCFFGQKLIDMSESVATAAYNSNWHKGSKEYKKLIFLIMLRAQRQAMISAKGFHPLSFETFQLVMGSAYRVFALLQTMLN